MSRTESIEIERKYDVGDLVRLPDLTGVGPVETIETHDPTDLRAVYYDTAEHLLLTNRITLRRREGGHDAGWHLKLPGGEGARREVHVPLGASREEELPTELRRVVEAVLRGRPVHPVLILETKRTITMLRDGDGADLAEMADDEVTASNPDTTDVRSWREWEVELAPGVSRASGEALQDAVADAFERSGAEPSASKSKLARGLGARSATPAPVELPGREAEAGSALEFVRGAVARLTAELIALDRAAREGDDDGVHRFRTTVRRLRSVLRVYAGVVADDEAEWLDEALQRLGRVSAVGRDLEVRAELLDLYADQAPTGFVTHETLMRPRASVAEAAREAAVDLERALGEPAYFELLDRLDALPHAEEVGEAADDDRDGFVRESLLAESKRTRKRVREAAPKAGTPVSNETVHRARKAARRLRYALEAAKAGGVKGTGDARKTAHALQDVLGDALDSGALADWLVDAAGTARWAEEDTFGYGVLATLAAAEHRDAVKAFRRLAKQL